MNRNIPLNELKDGMIIGKSVTDITGRLLVNAGATLTAALIDRIKHSGVSVVTIDDPDYIEEGNSQENEQVIRENQEKKFSDVRSNPMMEILWKHSTEYLVKRGR